MARLKYYCNEREEFADAFNDKIGDYLISKFFEKIKSRYKLRHYLKFGGRRWGFCNRFCISLHCDNDIGTLAHEVAHAIQFKHYIHGQKLHTKKHKRIMIKVLKYIYDNKDAWFKSINEKDDRHADVLNNRFKKQAEFRHYKKTDEYKIKALESRQKRLLSKRKRLDTLLIKIAKSINYYQLKDKTFKSQYLNAKIVEFPQK